MVADHNPKMLNIKHRLGEPGDINSNALSLNRYAITATRVFQNRDDARAIMTNVLKLIFTIPAAVSTTAARLGIQ